MDPRRGPRIVTSPVVRHVGFFTPAAESDCPNPNSHPDPNPNPNPNPNPIDGNRSVPLTVPSLAHPLVQQHVYHQGSYVHKDSVLDVSPVSSTLDSEIINFSEYDHDHGSVLSSAIDRMSLNEVVQERETFPLSRQEQVVSLSSTKQRQIAAPSSSLKQEQPVIASSSSRALESVSRDKQSSAKQLTSKAERRAKQEAEREAKRAARESTNEAVTTAVVTKPLKAQSQIKEPSGQKKSAEKISGKERKPEIPAPRLQFDDEHRVAKAKKKSLIEQVETKNRVELFRHLPQFVHGTQLPSLEEKFFHDDTMRLHPSIYQVGLQYLTGDIVGGNSRCVAMLLAFREVINDYSTPEQKSLVRDLTSRLNMNISFLNTCRPLSISMGNAIRFLKTQIVKLPQHFSEAECKSELISAIYQFIHEKITIADKEITKLAVTKIRDGDVILTYGASCVVEMIILHAFELGLNFRVITVDSRPKLEAKLLFQRLLAKGINCTYAQINAISYVMQEATKVYLGAASVLSNGTVYSRVGSACVAMVAHAFHVPVLVCCETYKFHERVQLDSICFNELGDPDALLNIPGSKGASELEGWTKNPNLKLLNLIYDAMPATYVSVIVTELGMVPPTSVAVILREHRKQP